MSFDGLLRHRLVIERATAGAPDDYGQPARAWATLSEVPGLIEPKTALEVMQSNQAGPVVSTFTVFLRPTDIQPADRVRVADGNMAGVYEIDGVRDAAGLGRHLEADCRMVEV